MANRARKKYASLDVAKFGCAVIVLLYHYFSEYGSLPSILEDALSSYAICVALFMVISGFLLYDKLLTLDSKEERWKVVKKQIVRIYQIYLLWSVPYLIYSISRWDPSELSFSFLFWKIQGWIFGSTFYTIWFMPSLAVGILISYITIEKFPTPVVIAFSFIAYVAGSLNSTYSFVIEDWSGYSQFNSIIKTWLNGSRGQITYGFPLVTIGYYIAKNNKQRIKKNFMLKAVLAFLSLLCLLAEALILRKFVGNTGIDMGISMILTVFCITSFLIDFPLRWNNNYIILRNMSVLIFVTQRIFLTVLPNTLNITNYICTNQCIGFLICCVGTIMLSFIIIGVAKRIQVLKILY